MRGPTAIAKKLQKTQPFDVEGYLSNAGISRKVVKFKKGQVLFSQDDPCSDVLYIQSGNAKLTIVNPQGKEGVLALLGPGDFLGESCIIGNPVRMATATALAPLEATLIEKKEMMRVLHDGQEFAGKFIHYMLERNIKIEADLVDQLLEFKREAVGSRSSDTGALRQRRRAGNHSGQNITGNSGGACRDNTE